MRVSKSAIALGVVLVGIAAVIVVTNVGHRGAIVGEGSGGSGSAGSGSGSARHVSNHEPTLVDGGVVGGVRLQGFVVDGAGLPVSGAEVSAEVERGEKDKKKTGTGTGSGSGSGSISPPPTAPLAIVAPATTADGRFELEGLEAGRYRLRVTGPGLLAADLRFVQVPSDAVRVVVARQVAIDGVVKDGDALIAGAHVGVRGDPIGGGIEVTTDAKGEFHLKDLPEGHYQVYAYEHALAARAIRVNRLGSGPFTPVELHLESATIVVGRIVDRDEGTGLVAAVELRPSGDDQAPRYARSGEDGMFRIEGVPNGRWIADAFAPGYLPATPIELDSSTHTVPELALVAGGTIEGRVLDVDGHPVDGAVVRALSAVPKDAKPASIAAYSAIEVSDAVDRDLLRRFSGRTTAPTAPLGGPLAPGMDPELLPRGELGVMVGPIPPIPPPGAQVARPTTPETSSLAGEPPPLPSDDRGSIWTTGSDGKYRIRGVPKGTFTVLAFADGYAEAASKPVIMGAKETHPGVDVVITAGTYLVGRITDRNKVSVVGALLSAQPDVGAPAEGFTDAAGEFRIGPVAGTVKLHVSAYGHVDAERVLELAATRGRDAGEKRVDLELEVADATLAGTIDDDAGAPVAGAHLSIVSAGGEGRHAIANPDGTFSFDMLAPGPTKILVEHPDYPSAELDAVATTGNGEHARLRLALGGAIDGVVLDHLTGDPVASIAITGVGPRGATAEASTDKQGRWKMGPLRAGGWKLSVKMPGYLTVVKDFDVAAAHAPGGVTVRDVRLELAKGSVVGGTVRDAGGHRVAGAHVVVHPMDGSTLDVEGDTDADGVFRIRDCPSGDLDLAASKGDARGTIRANVRPADEIVSLQIDIR